MSKRVANKKSGGGARSGKTRRVHDKNLAIAIRQQLRADQLRAVRVPALLKPSKPNLFQRAKALFRRRSVA